jgi:hypothetical protein
MSTATFCCVERLRLSALWSVSGRLGFRRTAIALLALLASSAFLLASRGGLTVGYGAVHMIMVLSAALFFGRRGAVLGLGTVLGVHLLAWSAVAFELVPPLETAMWDPRVPAVWLRHTVSSRFSGLVVAAPRGSSSSSSRTRC